MGRPKRADVAGGIYHMLNRANLRATIFHKPEDYEAFERIMAEALAKFDLSLLCYCVMPNHWHLVIHPRRDGDISRFMQWLQQVHAQRWNVNRDAVGTGHLYQGRYKSFVIQADLHLLTVPRYVEANPVRAGLVDDARVWRWGSAYRAANGGRAARALLAAWPVPKPRGWAALVNSWDDDSTARRIGACIAKGTPYGSERWVARLARRYGVESVTRPRGRPARS